MQEEHIKQIEKIIGYEFNDKSLLIKAFTHGSYSNEHRNCESYDKLEFFGDSILDFIVAEKLYKNALGNEGEMTMLRSRMVSRAPLSEAVSRMGLHKYILLGKGADREEIMSAKALSDIFESILAAIYLDSNSIAQARKFIEKNLSSYSFFAAVDYKSRLQEYAQSKKLSLSYVETIQKGSPSRPIFEAKVCLGDSVYGFGTGHSKKEAQQLAAKQIYESVVVER